MKSILTLTALILFTFCTASLLCAASMVTLPAHTLVPIVAMNHLKSGQCKEGEKVNFKTFFTVYGPNHEVLIPAGSEGFGRVTTSEGSGMMGRGGKLKFTCDFVVAGDHTHVTFLNVDLSKQGRTYNPITMLLVGGGLSLFSKGKDIDVDEGTPFLMEVAVDTPLQPVADHALGPVEIFPNKHKTKGYPATILGFSAETITITTDKGESTLKLKDVKKILLSVSTQPTDVIVSAPAPPVQPAVVISPPPTVPSFHSLFTFANGAQTVGTMTGVDGAVYTVSTPKGMRVFKAAAIKSIQVLAQAAAPKLQR